MYEAPPFPVLQSVFWMFQVKKCHVWHFALRGSGWLWDKGQVYGSWDGEGSTAFPGQFQRSQSAQHMARMSMHCMVFVILSLCVFVYFQDLLQLQYDGVAVMKMFDKAKVNVNLLIFLLNRKFYGKWKFQRKFKKSLRRAFGALCNSFWRFFV